MDFRGYECNLYCNNREYSLYSTGILVNSCQMKSAVSLYRWSQCSVMPCHGLIHHGIWYITVACWASLFPTYFPNFSACAAGLRNSRQLLKPHLGGDNFCCLFTVVAAAMIAFAKDIVLWDQLKFTLPRMQAMAIWPSIPISRLGCCQCPIRWRWQIHFS